MIPARVPPVSHARRFPESALQLQPPAGAQPADIFPGKGPHVTVPLAPRTTPLTTRQPSGGSLSYMSSLSSMEHSSGVCKRGGYRGCKEAEPDILTVKGEPRGIQKSKEVMPLGADSDSAGEIHLVLGPGPECLPTLACSRTPNILATRPACATPTGN